MVAGIISETGVPGNTKCPVAPASAIARLPGMVMLEAWNSVSFCDLVSTEVVVDSLWEQLLSTTVASASSLGVFSMNEIFACSVWVGCYG